MAILAPLAGPAGRGGGQRGSPGPQEDQPGAISTWRVRVSTPARHWLMRWAPFRRRRRRTSAPRTPTTRHGCLTTPSSPWRCRHGQMISARLWRGGCSAPWSWMTLRTSPTWGRIKEKYVPYIWRLREAQNPWNRRRCWKRCPIWRHRPPQDCHWPRGGPANATAGPGLGGG